MYWKFFMISLFISKFNETSLVAACHDIDQWQCPLGGDTVSLPIFGTVLQVWSVKYLHVLMFDLRLKTDILCHCKCSNYMKNLPLIEYFWVILIFHSILEAYKLQISIRFTEKRYCFKVFVVHRDLIILKQLDKNGSWILVKLWCEIKAHSAQFSSLWFTILGYICRIKSYMYALGLSWIYLWEFLSFAF